MVVADISEYDKNLKETKYYGQTILHNVEFDGCSQTTAGRGAIRFVDVKEKKQEVRNSTFHAGTGWGATLLRTNNVLMDGNFFFDFRSVGVGIDFAKNIKFRNNIVGQIASRQGIVGGNLDKNGGVCICSYENENQSCTEMEVHDNIVGGALYAGFIAAGHKCDAKPGLKFYNNIGHSVDGVGAFVYPDSSDSTSSKCFEVSHFKGYKNIREGAFSYFKSSKVIYRHMTMVDNLKGFTVMSSGNNIFIKNIMIFGETESLDCPEGEITDPKDPMFCF